MTTIQPIARPRAVLGKQKACQQSLHVTLQDATFFQSFLLAYFFCNPGRCLQRVGQKGKLFFFSVMPAKALRWQYCSLVHKGPCDGNIRVQWQRGSSRIIFTRLISGSSIPSRLRSTTFASMLGCRCSVSPLKNDFAVAGTTLSKVMTHKIQKVK